MNFAQQQRDPRRHLVGISTVVLFHIVLIYALANGLGRKVVEVLAKPVEVSIIEEAPAPRQPPKVIPPPAFVPPPEVKIDLPPIQEPVIAIAPTEPPPPAPVAEVKRIVAVGAVCPNYQGILGAVRPPPQAQGMSGKVIVEFVVGTSGAVGEVSVVSSSNRAFNAVSTAAVARLRCVGQEQGVRVRVPFVFEPER